MTCTGERARTSFKSFNNLPPISKVKNQVLRAQIQSYYITAMGVNGVAMHRKLHRSLTEKRRFEC